MSGEGLRTGERRIAERPQEVELKFRVRDLAAGERYLLIDEIAGFVQAAPTRTSQIEDHYVDTADRALGRAGFAARLRHGTSATVVTVKSLARDRREAERPREGSGDGGLGGSAALHRRDELEGPADRSFRPRDWPASDARSLILELCGDDPLAELATIRQLRRTRAMRSGGTLVELSLDEVDVVSRSTVVERFAELEVELVRGDETRLHDVAEVLTTDPALAPSAASKLEIALRAGVAGEASGRSARATAGGERASIRASSHPRATREGESDEAGPPVATAEPRTAVQPREEPAGHVREPRAPRELSRRASRTTRPAAEGARHHASAVPPLAVGKTPGVTRDDSIAEAGRKVLRFHFARMLAREPGTRLGSDPEELHAMRVATRRMRAAWRIFGDGFRPGRTRRYRRVTREIAARLGAVRDIDVLLEDAERWRETLPADEQRTLEPLLGAWRAYRADARALLLRELDGAGYARFVEDFRVFVQTDGAGAVAPGGHAPHRVRDTTGSRVWRALEQVRAYETHLRGTVETLHELRIAAKWLRYSIEFVREPLGPEAAPLIARVTALQDHLGRLHDADVAASLARTFLVEHGPTLSDAESAAVAAYVASREREVQQLRRTVGGPWRNVAGLGFRRALARCLASL